MYPRYFTKSYDETEKLNVKKPIKKPLKLNPINIKLNNKLMISNIQTIYFELILKVILIVFPNILSIIHIHII